ncbi:hypothetical protein [Marinobacter sp. 2_MG-2023]|uniref:hypothetical protein n=1 Tax=Marinobacter sp. 2_MG-2023 TaxID=3062679 RepID=UPI0026E1DF32|nr:hypothetical protein [Marinobacter sp. 2_MG-2023]MDO6443878.1 hypothetical protein [Marinobacter sp. 2_MG-2023]
MINKLLFAKKRQDRWWRFNTLKAAFCQAQHAGDYALEARVLSKAFSRMGYKRPPTDIMKLWHELVDVGATRRAVIAKTDIDRIEVIVEDIDPLILPYLCWLDLYHLCIGLGLYSPAEIMRNQALSKATAQAASEGSLSQLYVGFYAEIEVGHFGSAWKFLQEMRRQGCSDDRLRQAEWLWQVLSQNSEGEIVGYSRSEEPSNSEFARFIEGRQVALVGPVASSVDQGAEIDSHDVVVKFSYRGGDKGRDPVTQGRRLDVSYYNNTQAKALAEGDFDSVLSSLRWAVCINRKGLGQLPKNQANIRQLASFDWMLPDTHFNAGPNAVLDLLRFNPADIRVFNTDLMLSAGRFAGYNPAGAKPIDYTRSFIKTHDPILQYRFMERLWSIGLIHGDARFNEVMALGEKKYMNLLQKAHGANTQALF